MCSEKLRFLFVLFGLYGKFPTLNYGAFKSKKPKLHFVSHFSTFITTVQCQNALWRVHEMRDYIHFQELTGKFESQRALAKGTEEEKYF